MSLELKFLPIEGAAFAPFARSAVFAGSNVEWFEALEKHALENGESIPKNFTSYFSTVPDGSMEGESCYGVMKMSPYGLPLKTLTVKQVLDFLAKKEMKKPAAQAALAYLKCLPADQSIVLYWY